MCFCEIITDKHVWWWWFHKTVWVSPAKRWKTREKWKDQMMLAFCQWHCVRRWDMWISGIITMMISITVAVGESDTHLLALISCVDLSSFAILFYLYAQDQTFDSQHKAYIVAYCGPKNTHLDMKRLSDKPTRSHSQLVTYLSLVRTTWRRFLTLKVPL